MRWYGISAHVPMMSLQDFYPVSISWSIVNRNYDRDCKLPNVPMPPHDHVMLEEVEDEEGEG